MLYTRRANATTVATAFIFAHNILGESKSGGQGSGTFSAKKKLSMTDSPFANRLN
jgi:hypothetical protein